MTRALMSATLVVVACARAATVSEFATGITLSVSLDGAYIISVQDPAWTFGGNIGQPLKSLRLGPGIDRIGAYDEIAFQFQDSVPKQGAIRVYQQNSIVL